MGKIKTKQNKKIKGKQVLIEIVAFRKKSKYECKLEKFLIGD